MRITIKRIYRKMKVMGGIIFLKGIKRILSLNSLKNNEN